ncbi:MAG: tetratricopeptide repeat protein [Phycisphaerales bacterium]|jgi:tetratricopeptide (TPR) repeat protein|nr:tetratricopeptide repeat protein [Phycisphaerales bacterium]
METRNLPAVMFVLVFAFAFLCGCDRPKDDAPASQRDADAEQIVALTREQSVALAAEQIVALAAEHVAAGIKHQREGQHLLAICSYNSAITLKSDYAEAYYKLGRAIADYKRLVTIKPGVLRIYRTIDGAEAGPLGDELTAYKRAIGNRPDYVEAWMALGEIYSDLGMYVQEIAAWNKVIALKPDSDRAYFRLSWAHERFGQYSKAIQAARKRTALFPDDPWTYVRLGALYMRVGRHIEALETYKQLLAIDPRTAKLYCTKVHLNMGLAYRALGRDTEAIEAWLKGVALRVYDDHGYRQVTSKTYAQLSLIWLGLGRFDKSSAACKSAVRLDSDHHETNLIAGAVFGALGRYDDSLNACRRAVQGVGQYSVAAHYYMGNAYAGLGRHVEAARDYRCAMLCLSSQGVGSQIRRCMIRFKENEYLASIRALIGVIAAACQRPKTLGLTINDYIPPKVAREFSFGRDDMREYVQGYINGWRWYADRWRYELDGELLIEDEPERICNPEGNEQESAGFLDGQTAAWDAGFDKLHPEN